MRFFSPPDRSTFSGPNEHPLVEADETRLGGDALLEALDRSTLGEQRLGQHRLEAHAGHLGGVLQREEQTRLRALERLEREQVDAVERDRSAEHLVARPSHQHMGQRRLPRAVRTHDGMHFATRDCEVDATQDLASTDCGAKP